MVGCASEYHTRKVGLGETGDTALTGRGRTQCVRNFLQGGGAGNSNVWVGDVDTFGGNGEECGRDTHRFPLTYHGEAIMAVKRRDVGDALIRRRTGGSWNAVGTQLAMTYIGRRQATMSQWVALHPLFEVCSTETGYEGGGFRREAWWRQETIEKQLWATLVISWEAKRMRSAGNNVMQ